ncbi:hypothetical protein TNCV_1672751 [Trichonephila clavipes]|nr:hypothetical protein TNCV_1672751 [Trichonephila clavipes]
MVDGVPASRSEALTPVIERGGFNVVDAFGVFNVLFDRTVLGALDLGAFQTSGFHLTVPRSVIDCVAPGRFFEQVMVLGWWCMRRRKANIPCLVASLQLVITFPRHRSRRSREACTC